MARETHNRSAGAYEVIHARRGKELTRDAILLVIDLFILLFISYVSGQAGNNFYYQSISFLGINLLVFLQTVLIERLLRNMKVNQRACYRMSFLSSVGIGWFFLIIGFSTQRSLLAFVPEMIWGVFLMFWIVISAFLGGLVLTAQKEELVENNFPPSEEVAQQVYFHHQRIIGTPKNQSFSKRSFDILASAFGLWMSSPVWLLSSLLIWLEDPGPLLFVKNSVGRGGVNFRQYKFRTMIRGAEEGTGPILSSQGDQRVLRTGKILRKTALDELPQLVNILWGEMSFVGPRPQRTVMVNEYLKVMPEYAERHRVLPGLAGLAQVVGHYYLTPRQKLRFDRIYIQHANLGFDLLLICLAFLIAFGYRWKKDWNGRLPRWLLHGRIRR